MPESNAKRYWREKAERVERERDDARRIIAAQRRANASTQVTGVRLTRDLRAWAERRAAQQGHDLSGYLRALVEADRARCAQRPAGAEPANPPTGPRLGG